MVEDPEGQMGSEKDGRAGRKAGREGHGGGEEESS